MFQIDASDPYCEVKLPPPSVFATDFDDLTCCEHSLHHRHPFYQIIWTGEKPATLFCDFEHYAMKPYSMACIGPGQVHNIETDAADRATQVTFLGFTLEQVATYGKVKQVVTELPFMPPRQEPVVRVADRDCVVLENIFGALSQRFDSTSTGDKDVVLAYLNVILVELERMYVQQTVMLPTDASTQITSEFRTLVEKHFENRLKVRDYAQHMGITANHLVETVRNTAGETPKQIIQKRLLLEAKRRLVHTTDTVAEISMQLSFKSATYFGSWFKNMEGRTPADFRRWSAQP